MAVAGSWAYYLNDGFSLKYSRFVKVELWRQQLIGYTVDATTATDMNGAFAFAGVAPGTIALAFYAENPSAIAKDVSWNEYSWWTGWVAVGADWRADYTPYPDDPDRAVFAALDNILDERLWLTARTGWSRSLVVVYWPDGTWPYSTGDSISLPATQNGACIPAECAWDRQVVLHEYAHSIMYTLYGNQFPAGGGPDPHYIFSESSGGFALTEGWAEFMEGAVDGDANAAGLALENGYWADYLDSDWDGNIVEGAVANVFWDILDGVSGPDYPAWDDLRYGDNVDGGFSNLWHILSTYRPTDLIGVWNRWQSTFGVGPDLWAIFYHGRIWTDSVFPTNPSAFSSSHGTGTWYNNGTVSMCWVGAQDQISGVYGFSFAWDESAVTATDSVVDTTGTCVSLTALLDGGWYLHVRARDRAGNWNPDTVHYGPILVDRVPPGVPNVDGPSGWTRDASPIFSWAPPADLSGISGYSYSVDALPDNSVDTTTPAVSLAGQPEGSHLFYVRACDFAGNWGSPVSYVFLIDLTPPAVNVTSPEDRALIHASSITITWHAEDALSGLLRSRLSVDNGSVTDVGTNETATVANLADGWHTFSVQTLDAAGNSRMVTVSVHVDRNLLSVTGPYGPLPLLLVGGLACVVAVVVVVVLLRRRKRSPRGPT